MIHLSPKKRLARFGALFCSVAVALAAAAPSALAETHALIVVGLAGEQQVWDDFQKEQAAWETALGANGIAGERLHVVVSGQGQGQTAADAPDLRKEVKAVFTSWGEQLTAQDDAVLVMIGHGATRGERYMFQNKGDRLRGEDFAPLRELPVRSLTSFITGPGGYALAASLRGKNRAVFSATAVETEINHTVIGRFLADALTANPKAPMLDLLNTAAIATERYYSAGYRAETEHCTLHLGEDEGALVLEPPFELPEGHPLAVTLGNRLPAWSLSNLAMLAEQEGGNTVAPPVLLAAAKLPEAEPAATAAAKPGTELGTGLRDLGDLGKLPMEWKLLKDAAAIDEVPYLKFREATAEEKALFAEVPAPTEYPEAGGVMLLREVRAEIGDKLARTESTRTRLYVRDLRIRPLLDQLFSPPMYGLATLKYMRTISPNGTVIEVEPDALADFCRTCAGDVLLFAPGVEPGVIVESEYSTAEPAPDFGAYCEVFPLLQAVPTRRFEFSMQTKAPDVVQHKLYGEHPGQYTQEKQAYSHRQTWVWENLPATPMAEVARPMDELDASPRLAFTSYKQWGDFVGWYQRLMRAVRNSSDMLEAKAAELAKDQPSDEAKIKAVYDYVNNLRYTAISGGANAWRPRNPTTTLARQYGDCKDKANLLVALLDKMGIKAHFALVSRFTPFDHEFPSYRFNHALAVVPPKEGDPGGEWLWMDATDTSTPFGMLPPGDAGQWALVLTGEGEKDFVMRQIPTARKEFEGDSKITIEITAYDAASGAAQASVDYAPGGIEAYNWANTMRSAEPMQVRQALAAKLVDAWPDAEITDIQITAGPGTDARFADPRFTAAITFQLGAPGEVKLPRPFWTLDRTLAAASWGRQTDFELNYGYPQKFVQTFSVPVDLGILKEEFKRTASVLPEKFFDEMPRGAPRSPNYIALYSNVKTENGATRSTSELVINQCTIPAEKISSARELTKIWVDTTASLGTPEHQFVP